MIGVGALIVEGSRIVLVKRGSPPARGEWSIPGGLVDVGERLEDAVVREAFEETGLTVRPVCLVELVERIFTDDEGRTQYHYVLADYLCRVVDGRLCANTDADDAVWVEYENLHQFPLPSITRDVVVRAFTMLEGQAGSDAPAL